MKYILYGVSLLVMGVSVLLIVAGIHDLGIDAKAESEVILAIGLLLLAGILWVLIEISERLESLAKKAEATLLSIDTATDSNAAESH